MSLLALEGVGKRYSGAAGGRAVLCDVSLELDVGELAVVWGLKGSGRSTLLRVAAGIETPDSGAVRFEGRDLADDGDDLLGGGIGYPERTFRCDNEECGLVIDRDLNAALNLAALVSAVTGTASGAGTGQGSLACAQGEERFMGLPRCSSVNCEDGTGPRPGKTATVPPQDETAAYAH